MYQHGKRSKTKQNPKIFLKAAVFLGICIVIAALVLHKDLTTQTDEKSSVPILTEISATKAATITIDEPLFTLELPEDWEQTNRVTSHAANYYEWKSGAEKKDDRLLRLHIDTMPVNYKIVKLQPLYKDKKGFRLGILSEQCTNFAKGAVEQQRAQGNDPVEAKWENITFVCDPIAINQTIGTGTAEDGIGAKLSGSDGQTHRYFFYFEDHNIRPDDKMFQEILRSFSVR